MFAKILEVKSGYSVSDVTVLGYEKEGSAGTEKIPAAYIAAVARAFGESVEWILGLTDERRPPDPTSAERAFRLIAEVIEEARRPSGASETDEDFARRVAQRLGVLLPPGGQSGGG